MTMPNFLIIGAMKAGTTSLFNYLKQHPQIYMSPVKEPRFFAIEGEDLHFGEEDPRSRVWAGSVTTIDDYKALFDGVTAEKAIGEASPLYLCSSKASERIQYYLPNVRLIAILRHPVDRAFSHFLHRVNHGFEPIMDFSRALEVDETCHRFLYIEQGMYSTLLSRYYQNFSRQQIRTYLYDDLQEDTLGLLLDIFRFVEVDESWLIDTSKKYNVSSPGYTSYPTALECSEDYLVSDYVNCLTQLFLSILK